MEHVSHREQDDLDIPAEVKKLYEWSAPGRAFKKKTPIYYRTVLLIAFLIEVILFLFSQYMLMAVVVSFVFMAFVLATIPPRRFTYIISSEGFIVEDHAFLWQELYDFYFKIEQDVPVLHMRAHDPFLGEVVAPLSSEKEKEDIKGILLHFLPFREVVRKDFMEKSGDWVSKTFPMDRAEKASKKKEKAK